MVRPPLDAFFAKHIMRQIGPERFLQPASSRDEAATTPGPSRYAALSVWLRLRRAGFFVV
jgi:hypothetical protein